MRLVLPHTRDSGLDGCAAGIHKIAGMTVEVVIVGVSHQFVSQSHFAPCASLTGAGTDLSYVELA